MFQKSYVYIHTHNGMLFNHEKEQNSTICDSKDGP